MNRMTLPPEAGPTSGKGGGATPLCIANYAQGERVISRVTAEITDRKFNDIPVGCTGPATEAQHLTGNPLVGVQLDAQLTLIGGRQHETTHFNGNQQALLKS